MSIISNMLTVLTHKHSKNKKINSKINIFKYIHKYIFKYYFLSYLDYPSKFSFYVFYIF